MSVRFIWAIVLGMAGCHSGAREQAPDGAGNTPTTHAAVPLLKNANPILKVASYNLLYALGVKRKGESRDQWADAETLAVARNIDADVVLFQETNAAWEGALRASLAHRYPYCRFHEPKRYLPAGMAACAKRPILEDELLPSPLEWFPAQRIVVDAPGGVIEVLNVHLRPAVSGATGWWEVNRMTRADRAQEMRTYLSRLTGQARLVVGDFNDVHQGDVFAVLRAAGYESAFEHLAEHGPTWRSETLQVQLDHLAYDRRVFEAINATIVRAGHSDHFPIVVTLRRRGLSKLK